MTTTTALVYEGLKSLDTATLSGSYVPIGTPLQNAASILKIVNNSNVDLLISTDGTNDKDIVPSGTFTLYDAGTNKGSALAFMAFPKGTQFSAKSTVGIGSVYVVALYNQTVTPPPPL